MLVPWPVTAADYVEREMLRIHSHQNGIWLSSKERAMRNGLIALALLGLTWIGGQPLRAQMTPKSLKPASRTKRPRGNRASRRS